MQSNAAPISTTEGEGVRIGRTSKPGDAGPPFRVTVHDSVEAAEAPWRALEQDAILTPYQRYDWIKALLDSRPLQGERCAVVVVSDASGPAALLPLAVARGLGVKVARIIGADIGNADWLVMRPQIAPQLTPVVLTGLLAEAARQAGGIDVVALHSQPERWLGLTNPLLAFPHQPAPDHFYFAPVAAAGETGRLSSKHLRNIQRGKRRLEETMGPVVLRQAGSFEEIARVHAAFIAQRNVRFAAMGVKNVFAEEWFVAFFKRTAANSLGSDCPALRFHALYAGDEIVATSCGTCCGSHYSQYINSTDFGPAAKYSLMGILMRDLLAELAADGITSIDMGLGDFGYKDDWADKQVVFDGAIALTAAGRMAAPVILGLRRLRREIKHNKLVFGVLKRLRLMTQKQPGSGGRTPEAGEGE
jgi:CelD/BcsL family acetyltransferase involved in cellulose biosynthesis